LVEASQELYPVLVVGAPVGDGHLFNAAIVIHRGSLLGAVPTSDGISRRVPVSASAM
jgi:NAD+ synthase (glutamine-hydrolysing)